MAQAWKAAPGSIGQVVRQQLYGYRPIEFAIERAIDLAHTAGADPLLDLIRAKPVARRERHKIATILYQGYSIGLLRQHRPFTLMPEAVQRKARI